MRYVHAVRGHEIESSRVHLQQRVVGEFLRQDYRWSIRALELAPRRDADEDQAVVGRIQFSVRAPVIIARTTHEDLRLAFELLAVVKHSPLQLPIGSTPRLRSVDVTHEEEVSEEK